MAEQQVASFYLPVMQDTAVRLSVAERAISEFQSENIGFLRVAACELAALQLRMIVELFMLGSAISHRMDAGLEISETKWRPKDIFLQLGRVNEHPLPIHVKHNYNYFCQGHHQVVPQSQPVTFQTLAEIYGKCSDMLHVPSMRQVRDDKIPDIDTNSLSRWVFGLKELTKSHALLLPQRKIVLLCLWSGDLGSSPEVFRLDADGDSDWDPFSYPAFSLLP